MARDRVLFLQPPQTVPMDAEDFLHSYNVSTTGLAILGSLRDAGFDDLHFLDVACEDDDQLYPWNGQVWWKGLPKEQALDRIAEIGPDFVLVTAMFTCDFPLVDELCRAIKDRFGSRVCVILGGRQASLMPHWHLDTGGVDYLVQGEGEEIIVSLVNNLTGRSNGVAPHDIPGVLTRDRQPVIHPSRWARSSLGGSFAYDEVLFRADGDFRYKDVQIETAKDELYKRGRDASLLHSAPIMPTRGCPLKCRFCGSHFTPEMRHIGGDRLFDDVMYCYDKGVRVFYNISENFCLQDSDRDFVRRIAEFRESLDEEFVTTNPNSSFLPIYFNKDKTPNTELIDLLKRAGFDLITISLETLSPRYDDKRLFKRYSRSQIEALFQYFKDQGLALHLYMMSGFPGMTLEELRADVDLIRHWRESGLCGAASWSNLIYLPGTTYYNQAIEKGLFTEEAFKAKVASGFNFFSVSEEFNFSDIPTDTLSAALARLRQGDYHV